MVCNCFALYALENNKQFVPYFELYMVTMKIWYKPCIIRQYIHSKIAANHVLFSSCFIFLHRAMKRDMSLSTSPHVVKMVSQSQMRTVLWRNRLNFLENHSTSRYIFYHYLYLYVTCQNCKTTICCVLSSIDSNRWMALVCAIFSG